MDTSSATHDAVVIRRRNSQPYRSRIKIPSLDKSKDSPSVTCQRGHSLRYHMWWMYNKLNILVVMYRAASKQQGTRIIYNKNQGTETFMKMNGDVIVDIHLLNDSKSTAIFDKSKIPLYIRNPLVLPLVTHCNGFVIDGGPPSHPFSSNS